ncbi:hypothetical protein MMC11_003093 [Xylographa trunciseda]|nr:hypothetical protein [Xylographa trunciseda]
MTANDTVHPGKELLYQTCGFAYAFPSTVLLLNRQIKQEASQILYGRNPFFLEVHPNYDEGSPRYLRIRARRTSDRIKALAQSSIRPLVRNFVLKITVACHWLESRNGLDLTVKSYGSSETNQSILSLLGHGPILESLTIHLRLFNAGVVDHPEMNEDPWCKSTLPAYLQGLSHRARSVKIDHEILSPDIQRFFHEDNVLQLEQLRQQLQYRPVKKTSFLDLPREYRDVIYGYLFAHRHRKSPVMVKWTPASASFPRALLQSCRQINEEAMVFLYAHIKLSILIGLSSASLVMATVPPQYRSLIRHYDIAIIEQYDGPPTYAKVHDVCKELRAGPHIKSVRIQIEVVKPPLARPGNDEDPYAFVDGFAPLADHVDRFIVGIIATTERKADSSRDEECYRRLRGVLDGPAKWSYAYRDWQFKD